MKPVATLLVVRTLLSDPLPVEISAYLERRRRLGLDRKDEVWEGVLHVVPAADARHAVLAHQLAVILDQPARAAGLIPTMAEFNVGEKESDFRIPDGGLHRSQPRGVWLPTAALVVEILSPGDETNEKLPFYASHRVEEVLIVDPDARNVSWLGLKDGGYQPIDRSTLIDLGPATLAQQIDWP